MVVFIMIHFQERSKWLELMKRFANSKNDELDLILPAIKANEAFYDHADLVFNQIQCLIEQYFNTKVDMDLTGCSSSCRLAVICNDVNIYIHSGEVSHS